ncbi:hypothetical protein M153_11750002828 [Pseudoloma neurophilia]|uniref:Uncharacterized protein n=1 Tax=Pseudoloma neurophilia TaxID=146866 RepID=A0A0R0M1I4_9MICR|nr:hypothetical protein M153_11750002828 [Pseudoloma neurophilia]
MNILLSDLRTFKKLIYEQKYLDHFLQISIRKVNHFTLRIFQMFFSFY